MVYSSSFHPLAFFLLFYYFYYKNLQGNKIGNTAARMKLLNLVEDAAGFEKMFSWRQNQRKYYITRFLKKKKTIQYYWYFLL